MTTGRINQVAAPVGRVAPSLAFSSLGRARASRPIPSCSFFGYPKRDLSPPLPLSPRTPRQRLSHRGSNAGVRKKRRGKRPSPRVSFSLTLSCKPTRARPVRARTVSGSDRLSGASRFPYTCFQPRGVSPRLAARTSREVAGLSRKVQGSACEPVRGRIAYNVVLRVFVTGGSDCSRPLPHISCRGTRTPPEKVPLYHAFQ